MMYVVGRRIRELRRERKMAQAVFARLLGVAPPTLSQWEHGHRPFPASRVARAAEILEVPVDRLLAQPTRKHGRGRGVAARPRYPSGATIDLVSTMGRHEWETVACVREALSDEDFRVLAEEFPRDTRWELLLALTLAVSHTHLRLHRVGRWRLPLHAMHDVSEGVGDHLLQPTLVYENGDEKIVVFGQVWLNLVRYDPVRVDFLVYYKRRGQRGYWLYVEVDDKSSHEQKVLRDQARQLALLLPGLRYENHVVQKPWFRRQFLEDIRSLRAEAERRRRERLRRQRRLDRQRWQQAEERQKAG